MLLKNPVLKELENKKIFKKTQSLKLERTKKRIINPVFKNWKRKNKKI
jgi:hypothetical protein